MAKPKLALYWAASCGGCDIAVLDTELKSSTSPTSSTSCSGRARSTSSTTTSRRWRTARSTLTLFNGAIRNSENDEMAKLLRQKSKVLLCAFGSCASDGGIPGLANLTSAEEIQRYVYEESPSTVNPREDPAAAGVRRSRRGRSSSRTSGTRSRTLAAGGRRRLLHPGLPAAARPDQGRDRRRHGHPEERPPLPPKGSVAGRGRRRPAATSARARGT